MGIWNQGKLTCFRLCRITYATSVSLHGLTAILPIGPRRSQKRVKKRQQELSWGDRLSTQKQTKSLKLELSVS